MPPPPVPENSNRHLILDPELRALTICFKNAVVSTAEIYSFYADRGKLYAHKHSYKPPDSLTASLGREIERYDQLCDSIESQLLRAIATLQRNLRREEQRKKDAAMAANKVMTHDEASATHIVSEEDSSTSVVPNSPLTSSSAPIGRRPSAISISSLQRPLIPPKLDLSSTSLRMSEDPSLFSSGLASPVTLAPKSARPMGQNEFPSELMAAFAPTTNNSSGSVDVDLTIEDESGGMPISLDPTAGSSADKPIELDLETMEIDIDLFGDSGENDSSSKATIEGLFSPGLEEGSFEKSNDEKQFLTRFSEVAATEIFSQNDKGASGGAQNMPSPGTILARFASDVNQDVSGSGGAFDISTLDLSNFSPGFFSNTNENDMTFMMDDLLSMGGHSADIKGNSSSNGP
ncbi:hypothetical protein AMATHDRAFT_72467 [Amanita thiersii Skay4041]|uniref:Uncharacterized protein n=1 Tax=Amanita thiersii Skay4041 TaxID=703135 RepID=A0A2A9NYL0_9AGAR|nr:hypothetical protein AMATHDRAFT_72467 [Amanita thiersii Skay4041]